MATCLVVGATTGPPQWPRKQCRPARWLWHQRRLPGHADGIRSVDGSHGAHTMQCTGTWESPQRPPTSIHVVRQSDAAMWVAWATAVPQTGPDNTTQALTYTALLRTWLPDCPPGQYAALVHGGHARLADGGAGIPIGEEGDGERLTRKTCLWMQRTNARVPPLGEPMLAPPRCQQSW